jgi:uncharacterized membrane protein YgcG
MNQEVEERIRDLAQPLWNSAAQPYNMAIDFWLMAEQMVVEMMTATARLQADLARTPPPMSATWLPETAPVARIRALAECMWEAAGRQYGLAQEFWLAAERHVLTTMRAAANGPAGNPARAWAEELATLTPQEYLERIRTGAYLGWERAGRSYGDSLEFWLQAERDVLGALAACARSAEAEIAPVEADDAQPSERGSGARRSNGRHGGGNGRGGSGDPSGTRGHAGRSAAGRAASATT